MGGSKGRVVLGGDRVEKSGANALINAHVQEKRHRSGWHAPCTQEKGPLLRADHQGNPLSGYGGQSMKVSLTALALASLALAPMAVAQGAHPQTDRTKGTELVAWTQDQKPQPTPATQPTPPDQKPQTETPSTPANSGQNSGQKQTSATKSFTGTVM